MPNWTTNYLACHEDDLRRIVNEQGDVDFNLITPMPEVLDITAGSVTDYALRAYRGEGVEELAKRLARGAFTYQDAECEPEECKKVSTMDELKALGARYVENEKLYGAMTWYDWCLRNWGTKWNACDTEIESIGPWRIVKFETAWSQPAPDLIVKAFKESGHGFVFEAYDENYTGIYGLGYSSCNPVLLTEPAGSEDGWEYPERIRCDGIDFGQLATDTMERFGL